MSLEGDSVIILDDDDDEVEFLGTTKQVTERETQRPERRQSRTQLPQVVNGYVRPVIHYPKLITQTLITFPDKRATANQICEVITKNNLYFKFCPEIWKKSVYSALTKRRKFFHNFGVNENHEDIWGLNPSFENIMISKWVPRYMQLKYLSQHSLKTTDPPTSSVNNYATSNPVIVNCQSLRPQSPIFVSSGKSELVNYEALIPETNCEESEEAADEPEFALEDPDRHDVQSQQTNVEPSVVPWEPEVTVSDSLPDRSGQGIDKPGSKVKKSKEIFGVKIPQKINYSDFSLENLKFKQIRDDEIHYRLEFQKEHPKVEKFRLHCTVCDKHLGTSSLNIKANTRFHCRLGVLVCTTCYLITSKTPFRSCQWCDKEINIIKYSCSKCSSLFCESCLKRNFGNQWYQRMFQSQDTFDTNWKCILCEPKNIWPHRAIAYFLYRHYKDLKRQKLLHLPSTYQHFLKVDLSTCCKPKYPVTNPVTSPILQRLFMDSQTPDRITPVASATSQKFVLNNQSLNTTQVASATTQKFVIDDQTPNEIYLTTPPVVSSVTLNTGTQYIHNVYPNRNYVVVQAPTQNENTVPTSTLSKTVTHSHTTNSSPLLVTEFVNVPNDLPQKNTIHSENMASRQSNNALDQPQQMIKCKSWTPAQVNTVGLSNNSSEPQIVQATEVAMNEKSLNFIVTSGNPDENNIIIPDKNSVIVPDEDCSIISNNKVKEIILTAPKAVETQVLTARQRIERRPMPKSKKQSLLRTVLMNESIESMKRHLKVGETEANSNFNIDSTKENTETSSNQNDVASKNNNEIIHNNVEEPILKSIIETATKCLFELQKKQNPTSSSCQNSETIDNSQQDPEPNLTKESSNLPKIKIRTLKELQDQSIISEQNNAEILEKKGEVLNCNNDVTDGRVSPDEVNVTPLKEGIIEACRTLVSTQKKLKELATVISCNLLYEKEKAKDLVSTFQKIVKSCQSEFDVINKTVKNEFCNVVSYTNMDSLYESMKNAPTESTNERFLKKRRKRKISKIHGKRKKSLSVSNSDQSSCVMTSETAGRSNVDEFNLLDNQPSVLHENLPLTNHQILKLKIIKGRKKRCLWNDKRRKRSRYNYQSKIIRYNKDGSIMKQRGRPRKHGSSDNSDDDFSSSQIQRNTDLDGRLRKQNRKPVLPLRMSGRKHPSSEAYISHFISTEPSPQFSRLVKPCSVLLHRLHPRIVELLKMRAAKVL